MFDGVPQPPLLTFTAYKAPHLILLGVLNLADDDIKLRRIKALQQTFVDLFDRGLFFFKHVDDRGRTDPQDTDDIAHTTAIERHAAPVTPEGASSVGSKVSTSLALRIIR